MASQSQPPTTNPEKSYMGAVLLSLLLGVFGVDRFYLGKIGTGIVKLLTFGGFGIWYIIDLVLIYTNGMRTKDGKALTGYQQDKKLATWFIVGYLLVNIFSGLYLLYVGNNYYQALKQGIIIESEEGTVQFKLGEPIEVEKP